MNCPVQVGPRPVTEIIVGCHTSPLVEILLVPGALRAGRLGVVVIVQPELILLSYPVHVAGGVRHHGGVGSSVDVDSAPS